MPADTSSSLEMTLCGEPVMVFAGMSPQAVSRFLDRMKEMGLPPISLKAVLPPTSAGWTMPRLAQELMKERKALS